MDGLERALASVALDPVWSVLLQAPDCHYELRADVPRPAASLLKLGIVLCALEQLRPQQAVLREELTPSRYPSLLPALPEELSVRQLCALSLMVSDNGAASWLLRELGGPDAVTDWLHAKGYVNSFIRCGFDDEELDLGGLANKSTARDVAAMLQDLSQGPAEEWLSNNLRSSRIPALLPELRIVHKTGTLAGAVHDAAIVGDSPAWTLVILSVDQASPARTSLQIAELAAGVRQHLLAAGLVAPGPSRATGRSEL